MASALEDDGLGWASWPDTSAPAIPTNLGQPPQDAYLPPQDTVNQSALGDSPELTKKIIFGGEQGATRAPVGTGPMSIDVAKKMEGNEVSANDIFNQTGWYRGPDQQWKWTLSDEGAKLNPDAFSIYTEPRPWSAGVPGYVPPRYLDGLTDEQAKARENLATLRGDEPRKLSDILHHPTLFETYPHLKDVNVERLPEDESGGAVAEYDPSLNRIRLAGGRPHTAVLESILHEIQHRVQQDEGFSAGGNLLMYYPEDVQRGRRRPTEEERNKAYDDYERTAGETEARQVQAQLRNRDWSRLPTQMEGFPAPADQIVRQGKNVTTGRAYQEVDPSAQSAPSALGDTSTPLPPQDTVVPAPGLPRQGYTGNTNDIGIYATPKPPPAGDVVLPSERTTFADTTPRVNVSGASRDVATYDRENRQGFFTDVSYAGDTLSPYARGEAQLGGKSSVEGVRDDMARKFNTMVAAMPPEVRARVEIHSGFRSPERNIEVYRQYGERPSKDSRHSHRIAMDLGNDPVVQDWIMKNPQYGLGFPLRYMGPKEYNHLEMIDAQGNRVPVDYQSPPEPAQAPSQPPQTTPSATAADQPQQPKAPPLHPIETFESAVQQYPVIHNQGLIAGPGKKLEYWPPNEPGTPQNPRPDYIPIDQAGMEIGPDSTPIDVLGDVASHHMAQKDPVIKKYYESFKGSMTDTQKELMQAQYMYSTKYEGETRPYAQWEKSTGLPAYFRGYAFNQWPRDFNDKAYTPQQRYHFDQMMGYLRGGQQQPQSALQ